MSPELISLHLSQLEKAIENSKTNVYADPRKKDYHDKLLCLFERVKGYDLISLPISNLSGIKLIIDFCFVSFEFLDNSILTSIPHETVYCLEKALSDWDNTNQYIIVTSLQNDLNSFSFNSFLSIEETYYDFFKAEFSLDFKYRLIQINLPKYLAQDYLASVILYHELGHFVDLKFKITERLSDSLGLVKECQERTHYREFFSDIFASQYIGGASNIYLNYIAYQNPDCVTHPSTLSRIKLVEDFLNGTNNVVVNNLKQAAFKATGKNLKNRRSVISDEDFKNFIPAQFNTIDELHSIFEIGWNLWRNIIPEFETRKITLFEKYQIINNLIEKSISNYIVIEKWNKHVLKP